MAFSHSARPNSRTANRPKIAPGTGRRPLAVSKMEPAPLRSTNPHASPRSPSRTPEFGEIEFLVGPPSETVRAKRSRMSEPAGNQRLPTRRNPHEPGARDGGGDVWNKPPHDR